MALCSYDPMELLWPYIVMAAHEQLPLCQLDRNRRRTACQSDPVETERLERAAVFVLLSRSAPTANAEDPCRRGGPCRDLSDAPHRDLSDATLRFGPAPSAFAVGVPRNVVES